MHNQSRFILLVCGAIFVLTSCNFPNPNTATPNAPIPIETAGNGMTATGTSAAPATAEPAAESESTAGPATGAQAGPIQRLAAGTALAISYIDMIDADKGWAIGGSADSRTKDHVFRTTGGGTVWQDITPPENTIVQPATNRVAVGGFWDAENALITYYSEDMSAPAAPIVWKTVDGGATWTASSTLDITGLPGKYRVSDLFFININTAWVLAHKGGDPAADRIALFQSVNGGNTWQRLVDPAVDSPIQDCEKTGILFTGPWIGWLTGDCHGKRAGTFLYQTFNGGKSWIEAKLPSPPAPAGLFTTMDYSCRIHQPVYFAQDTNLVLCVECATKAGAPAAAFLFSSNLDGSNWHTLSYPGGEMAVRSPGDGRVFRGDVGSGLAIGADVYLYNGETWQKIGSIDWTGQLDFIDWNRGWAAAVRENTPLFLYTADGGRTWNPLSPIIGE